MRKVIFERLGVPPVAEDARKQRIFSSGDIFHEWMQRITKAAGLSLAQELELQDEDLMIRGHIDDLVLVKAGEVGVKLEIDGKNITGLKDKHPEHLILYDYKTQNSQAFSYKRPAMSHYHRMQLGTYMYMLRNGSEKIEPSAYTVQYASPGVPGKVKGFRKFAYPDLTEGRILKISKDDLRMTEEQLLWTPNLEKDIVSYWATLNGYWAAKTIPKCTCKDYEGGFMSKEAYNPFYYEDEPCSLAWLKKWKEEQRDIQKSTPTN